MSRPATEDGATFLHRWTTGERLNLLATAYFALALGCLVGGWPIPTLLVFTLLAFAIGTVRSRAFALGAILVSALLMLSITDWFGLPWRALLFTNGLIGLFALAVLLDVGPGNPLRFPTSLVILAAALTVSAVVGAASKSVAFYSLAIFMAAPIAYVGILHSNITLRSLRRVALIVTAIAVAQLPIVLVEARIFTNVDQMGGTFGLVSGTHFQSVLMGFAWTIAVALLYGWRRLWLLPVGLAIALVLLVSEAKAGFIFAAVGTVVVGLVWAINDPERGALVALQYVVICMAVLAAFYVGYMWLGSLWPGGKEAANVWNVWFTNPSAIINYMVGYNKQGNAERLEAIRLVLSQPSTLVNLLIGRGLGLLTSAGLIGQNAVSLSASLNGALDRATSAAKALYEIGILGVLLYLVAIGAAAGAVVKSWASREDNLGLAVGAAAVGVAAVYATSALYMASWHEDAAAVLFWCLMGIAAKWGRLRAAEPERDSGEPLESDSDQLATPA